MPRLISQFDTGGANTPIALYAYNDNTTYTTAVIIKWNQVVVDTANAYSTSTGQFTCPRKGIYEMSWYYLHRGTVDLRTQARKNSSYIWGNNSKSMIYADGVSGAEINVKATVQVECAIGDTLDVFIASISSGADLYGSPNSHNGYTIKWLG